MLMIRPTCLYLFFWLIFQSLSLSKLLDVHSDLNIPVPDAIPINGMDGIEEVCKHLGPVAQSIVSLTSSLRRQLVKYMPTTLSNPQLFFVGKM